MTLRLLVATDRLSDRGGADHHLLDLLHALARRPEVRLRVAAGRLGPGQPTPPAVPVEVVPLLAGRRGGGEALDRELAQADAVWAQNVVEPEVLAHLVAHGRTTVTVQDHRVYCPGPGRTLPEGDRCLPPPEVAPCHRCLPDDALRGQRVGLTRARTQALRGARLVVLSRFMRDELALAGLPGAAVLPPWVVPGPPRLDAGQGWVLAGRLVRHKAPELAFAAWAQAGGRLMVAGEGPVGAPPGAEALGWCDRGRLREVLRGARALLFPAAWQEPWGLVGVEALAEGVPVVAVVRGGMADWAGPGVIPVHDAAGMAEAMRRLHDDPQGALDLGEQGRSRVGAWTESAAVDGLLRVLRA